MIIDLLDNRWNIIEPHTHTKSSKQEFVDVIKFVLNSTYFKFNNKIYKQTFGPLMESPFSPIVADLMLQNFESYTLKNLSFISLFYIRYVDDITLTASRTLLNELLKNFNFSHPRLTFTMEIGGTLLSFLELTFINRDENLFLISFTNRFFKAGFEFSFQTSGDT